MSKLPSWKPGAEICIIFDDLETQPEKHKTHDAADEFINRLQALATDHGFNLSVYGLRDAFEKSINKKITREQVKEIVTARDHQLAQLYPECKFLETGGPNCLPEISINTAHGEVKI